MSFGYSIGDILAILKLADDVKKRFSQAPKEFRTISEEVKRVWTVLHDIHDIPVDGLNKQQGQDVQRILQGCRDVLEDLKVKLDKSEVLAYTTSDWKIKARQAWGRITWDQAEIDRLRDKITSTISLFNLLMGKINQTISLEIRNDTRLLLEEFYEDSAWDSLSWISTIDGSKRYAEILSTRQTGTGTWFINKEEFQTWLHNEKQLLYCPGIPGAGKTVLCSVALECLAQSFANDDDIGITYIFFDFRRQLSLFEILAALLRQLLQGTAKKSGTRFLRRVPKKSMKLEWIQSEFTTLILDSMKTFIILDALDECSSADGTMRQLLDFLFSLQRKANVNILATSRFSEETANLFVKTGVILEIQANEDDVRAYIDHRAAYFSPFVAKKRGLLTYIRDAIAESSRGMFLLAKLYVNLVQDEINEKRIRKVIERFQNSSGVYDDVYDETMKRIEHQGPYAQEIAKTIFGWVLFSTRALSLPEIQHALAVEIGESEFDGTNITDIEQLMSICIGLVTIDGESNSFKFVHYTTKEYFERKLDQWFPDIHRVITSTCLTYISLDVFNQGPCKTEDDLHDRFSNYPFYKYSAQNWCHHYKKHAGEESMMMEFLAADNKVHASSQVIFGFFVDPIRVETFERRSPKSVTKWTKPVINIKESLKGAHLAAFFGLTSPLASMVNSNMIKVDIEDHAGRTPLSWAVAYGHEELSNMLLQNGANPDSMNQFGFTPLFYAAVSGKVGIMQSLIKAGAQVNTIDQNGRTPLFHAAAGDSSHLMSLAFEGDCLASVELLLDYGASATQVDNFGRTPLFAAASNGREFVVKLLIEKNAHLYYAASPDSGVFDPLAYAAMNGHSTTAKLLFEAGAYSVSAHSGGDAPSYVTLANLLKAGSEGRDDAFKDLKDEGADPNIRDSHHRLPLHWAALKGDDNLLKCLLANGADVNAKEAFGRTPLFYAIFGGRHSTALLLLDYPDIDFQAMDIFGDTPLIQSHKRQHQGNQWKLHNLLKIKSGDYDDLLYDTGFFPTPQSPLSAICDACRQYALCFFSCTNCTSPAPPSPYPYGKVPIVKYCEFCISRNESSPCPLCGHTLKMHEFS